MSKGYKRVTRTYTRKDGTKIKSTYTYRVNDDGSMTRVSNDSYGAISKKTFLTKTGKTTKAYDSFVNKIMSDDKYTSDEKRTIINDLNVELNDARLEHKSYSEATWESHNKNSRIERYIYNLGGDTAELARQLGVEYEDFTNEYAWTRRGDELVFKYGANAYAFSFDYNTNDIKYYVV